MRRPDSTPAMLLISRIYLIICGLALSPAYHTYALWKQEALQKTITFSNKGSLLSNNDKFICVSISEPTDMLTIHLKGIVNDFPGEGGAESHSKQRKIFISLKNIQKEIKEGSSFRNRENNSTGFINRELSIAYLRRKSSKLRAEERSDLRLIR